MGNFITQISVMSNIITRILYFGMSVIFPVKNDRYSAIKKRWGRKRRGKVDCALIFIRGKQEHKNEQLMQRLIFSSVREGASNKED